MPNKNLEELTKAELIRELEATREAAGRMTPLPDDSARVIHELHVHQLELEMQNRELRDAQSLLEESRSRYADLYDFAPIGYMTLDASGVIREINLTGAAMLGVPRDRLVGRPFASVVAMANGESFRRHLERCCRAGDPRVVSEWSFSVPGRGPVVVQAVSTPEPADAALVCRTALVDISSLKQSEGKLQFLADVGEALAGSLDFRATLSTVVQLAVPGIADLCAVDLVDAEGRLERLEVASSPTSDQTSLVDRLHRLFSMIDGDSIQKNVLVSGVPRLLQTSLETRYDSESARALEGEALRACRFSSVMIVPLATRGQSLGTLTLAASYSARRRTEADLALASDLGRRAAAAIDIARLLTTARRAVGARDQVLAVVAHDLRNPLSSIRLRLDTLEQSSPADERRVEPKKSLGPLRRAVTLMERLTSDLLDFGSIERGQLAVTKRPESVKTILTDTVEVHQPAATKKSLALSADLTAYDFKVVCDRARISQALSNLISNAIKFTERGSIRVEVERIAGEAWFSVVDSGPGIAEKERAQIFERYWRGAPGAEGVGLGLAIARGIVEAHGGRIWVEGNASGGSTFRFAIPRVVPPTNKASQALPLTERQRVLVVDDDELLRDRVTEVLQPHGYEVIAAGDGVEALEALRAGPPVGLILLDLTMPTLDGYDFLKQRDALPAFRSIPVIVTSGKNKLETAFAQLGFDFLAKPYADEELVDAVTRILGLSG